MPGPFVIDASVFLNAFNPAEERSKISMELMTRLRSEGIPMIAPTLLLPEVAASISRGQDDPELARSFADALSRISHLTLAPLDHLLARQSLDMAALYRLRGSDAVYVAVAQRYASPLITLDREQHDRASTILTTYYPEEILSEIKS